MIPSARPVPTSLQVAVVHGPDTEPFVAVGTTHRQVIRRLARYVARNAPHLLRAEDASRVAGLLADRDLDGAVERYFEALGDPTRPVRWERQWLVLRTVRLPADDGAGQLAQGLDGRRRDEPYA